LLVISPLHNEAAHTRRLVATAAGQKRRPDLWLAVDHGSTDETLSLLGELSGSVPFMRVLSAPQRADRSRCGRDADRDQWRTL
jgi:biofilm PGA synthesis N-glycosyltransferase PgaC